MLDIEAGDVIDLLADYYPAFYAKKSPEERMQIADRWAVIFIEDDVRLVLAAVKAFVASDEKGFPPVPGQIKAKIRLITASDELSETEAWNLVSKATKNSAYHAAEEFEKLPPIVRKLVGSPEQLRVWANMDSETVHSVVAALFQKAFRTVAERERVYRSLTPDVKELVTAFAAAKAMPELSEEGPETLPTKSPEMLPPCGTEKPVRGRMPEKLREELEGMRSNRTPEARPEMTPVAPRVKRNRAEVIEALRSGKF